MMEDNFYISECGKYIAVRVSSLAAPAYDVVRRDGRGVWLWPRYVPVAHLGGVKNRRFTHPEFPRMCGYWGRPLGMKPFRKYEYAFHLGISDHDQSIRVKAGTGNTITKDYPNILFRKRLPPSHAKPAVAAIQRALDRYARLRSGGRP